MNELIERPLTPIEIKQRQVDHLRLLTEIDNYRDEIAEHRRCAKDAATEVERLEQRERQLRKELRSGTVFEARQKTLEFADTVRERPEPCDDGEMLPAYFSSVDHDKGEITICTGTAPEPGIDGNTDDPDPETDPPGPDPFALAYPMARDHEKLRADLAVVLQGVLVPTREQLGRYHPSTGVFDAIAHWTRLELACMNRESHPDLDIPTPLPMPEKLAEMRTEIGAPAKKKRGARPLSSPKKGKG